MENNDEVETERRFLLKRLPKVLQDFGPYQMSHTKLTIEQHYLSEKKAKKTERVRCTVEDVLRSKTLPIYHHTTKERISDMSATEIEGEISANEYGEHIFNSKRSIKKIRHIVHQGDLKWEIDEFTDMNLIIAEIELPSEDHLLEIPNWLEDVMIMEITGEGKFSNSNLSE